jgi:glycerophosphoryl diester phosphodiesterase
VAHRGAAGTAPENTVVGAEVALRQGAAVVEVDVQRTVDGELVVFHDSKALRTTDIGEVLPDRAGRLIGELAMAELRKLDAGSWFDRRYRGAGVPTLAEMLEAVAGRATLLVELKFPERYPGIVREVVAELRRCVGAGLRGPDVPVAVQVNDPVRLRRLRDRLPPQVPLCLMSGLKGLPALESLAELAGWVSCFIPLGRDLTVDYVERVHGYDMVVCPWTIDAPEAVTAMREVGADAVVTNYLPEVMPVLRGEPSPLPRTPVRVESADVAGERFVLRNVTDRAVDLAGWSVRNQLMVRQFLPAGPLAPGDALTLDSAAPRYLDNYGENLALHDDSDRVVDLYGYRLTAARR